MMLERTPRLASFTQARIDGPAAVSEFISYAEIASFVRRYVWTIVGPTLIAAMAAGLYILAAEPIFTARSELLIDPKTPILREQTGEVNFSLDNAQVESHIAVLRSEKIATMVIEALHLVEDPEFQEGGNSLLAKLSSRLWGAQRAAPSDFERSRHAIAEFGTKLSVRRLGFSYAIEISFKSRDPEKAARIANATADAYVSDQIDAKSHATRQGSEWLEQRLAELRAQMNSATYMVQEFKAKHDYRIGKKRDGLLGGAGQQRTEADNSDQKRDDYTLEELETTAETYRKLYESFLQAFTASVYRQSYPVSDARIISPATRPFSKSHPQSKLILVLAVLSGIMAGLGISVVRHSLDRSIRSSRQIRDQLGLQCLGEVPRIKGASVASALAGAKRFAGRTSSTADSHYNEIARAPFSRFASGIRSIKTTISLANRSQPIRCFGVMSALPKEGKSTVAANLAIQFSISGARTLIIDADIHNSTLTRQFAPGTSVGLIDALRGSETAEHYIVPAKNAPFDLLPSVSNAVADSNDVLGSEKMQALLQDLRQAYDTIIVDLPPLLPVVDGLAISPLLDGVVLVVECGKTPVDLVAEVSRSLQSASASMLGIVITKADSRSTRAHGRPGTYFQ